MSEWPLARPADWLAWVNEPQTDAELLALRTSIAKGRPYGEPAWRERTIEDLGLHASLRDRGRPKKQPAAVGRKT